MGRVALTFWFAVTTLLGPGVCCCAFASVKPPAVGDRTSVTTAKTCCDQDAPPCCPNHDKHGHEPGNPSKCPCEKGKQVTMLPPAGTANAELSAQLKLFDAPIASLFSTFAFDTTAVGSDSPGVPPAAARPAGRDLLAVYSLLRC